jgi:hypothetical protein
MSGFDASSSNNALRDASASAAFLTFLSLAVLKRDFMLGRRPGIGICRQFTIVFWLSGWRLLWH